MRSLKENGSSLIEVVIAMLILAVLVVGLNAGVVSLIKSNMNAKELSSATTVGNEKFDYFRSMDYDLMAEIVSSNDIVRQRYVREWKIDKFTTHTEIEVTVRWPYPSLKHDITLSTIISKP